jgi:hypothetical protein
MDNQEQIISWSSFINENKQNGVGRSTTSDNIGVLPLTLPRHNMFVLVQKT